MGQKILYSPEQMDVSNGIDTFSIYLCQNLHSRKLRQKKVFFTKLPQSRKNTFMQFWIPACTEMIKNFPLKKLYYTLYNHRFYYKLKTIPQRISHFPKTINL
jgi:hypothetical protein